MRAANKAIKRKRHPTSTLNELKTILSGANVFSKLDLHQLELAEESRYITTFATHLGLYRYKRLFIGINSTSEIFQEEISQAVEGINGAINISDDITDGFLKNCPFFLNELILSLFLWTFTHFSNCVTSDN